MKWHDVALVILANDVLLFAIGAVVETLKNKRLNEKLDEMVEVDENVDWELEQQALEANFITEDEVNKMSKEQAFILNEWLLNRIEKEK